jgi:AbrB family looped-hinge helix DNA binding protein
MTVRIAKVTSKGQVTIPKPIREELGIEEQDRLLFTVEAGRLIGTPVSSQALSDLYASLPASRPFPGRERIREVLGKDLGKKIARGAK